MVSFDICAIAAVTVAILLVTTPHAANAAVTCDQVVSALAQCMPYTLTGEGNPTVQCCNGIKSLNSMAVTDVEHQAVCNCLKNLAKGTTVNASAAAGLPGKCGVIVPFTIGTSTDCSNMKPNVVVAKDGSGHYNSVRDAIHNMPSHKGIFVIYVKSGVYPDDLNITIRLDQNNVYLYGDGYHNTIITGSKCNDTGFKTNETATFSVDADNFTAKDITFRNTAGVGGNQAVAFHINGKYGAFYKCRFEGFQDTLWVQQGSQFFRECIVTGTVDIIFGDSQAFFQNCDIYVKRPSDIQQNVITASGRSAMNDTTGIVLQNCRIKAALDLKTVKAISYLGRPWKEYSRAVIMETFIDRLISPEGWLRWNNKIPSNTIYFAEYANTGPGSSTAKRVNWTGYHVIGRKEARKFTSKRFIHADRWMPNRTIPYYVGFTKRNL